MVNPDLITEISSVFTRFEDGNTWKQYFMEIHTESFAVTKELSVNTAKKSYNHKFNRYTDVLSYDQTRVLLSEYNETDYINANFVTLDRKFGRRYILAQGPLPHTVPHFWSMIWENNSKCIIMVTKDIEQNKVKCAQYYPTKSDPNKTIKFSEFSLDLSLEKFESNKFYKKSVIKVVNSSTKEMRYVNHFYYDTWPDFGVPNHPNEFLQFLWDVRASGGLSNPEEPSVVHCSAGIGRSGTFVVVDLALLFVEHNEAFGSSQMDVKELIMRLRKCRYGLVQSPEQLRFLYQAILKGATEIAKLREGEDIANIKFVVQDNLNICSQNNSSNNSTKCLTPFLADGDDSDDLSEALVTPSSKDSEEGGNNAAGHRMSLEEEIERDSDFDEVNSDAEHDNSALENAAQAVRNRRGIPVSNGNYEGSFEFTKQNNSHNMGGKNPKTRHMNIQADSLVSTTSDTTTNTNVESYLTDGTEQEETVKPVADQTLPAKRQSILASKDSRDDRTKRTRVLIAEIRENMRRRDMERERHHWLIPRFLRQFLTTENPTQLVWRVSLVVGPAVSLLALFLVQKFWASKHDSDLK